MIPSNLLELFVSVTTSGTDRVSRDLRGLEDDAGRTERGISSSMKAVGGAATLAGAALTTGLVVEGGKAIASLARIEKINAQTASALESTGGAANITAGELESLAGSIELKTSVEAESVQEGENLLLTFTNLRNEAGEGNDIFNQATEIMTDMSVALGTDAKSSAIQLGKALNDPIKGISALQRVGVTFTEEQKAQITAMAESGDMMGAQKLILAELNKEFGGSAAALGGTLQGQWTQLGHQIGTFTETVMSGAMPALGFLTRGLVWLTQKLNGMSPATQTAIAIGAGLVALFTTLGGAALLLVGFLGPVVIAAGGLSAAFAAVVGYLTPLLAVAIPFVAVVAALAAGGLLLYRNWSTIGPALGAAFASLRAAVLPVLVSIAGAMRTGLGSAFAFVRSRGVAFMAWLRAAWPPVRAAVLPVLTAIAAGIRAGLGSAFRLVQTQARSFVTMFRTMWPPLRAAVLPILTALAGGLRTALGGAFRFLLGQGRQFVAWFRRAFPPVRAAVMPVLTAIAGAIRTVLVAAFRFAISNARLVVNFFRQNWPLIRQTTLVVFNAVKAVITGAMQRIGFIIRTVWGAARAFWNTNSQQILAIARSVWTIIKTVIQTALRVVLGIIKATMQAITGDWRGAWDTIKGVLSTVWEAMKTIVRSAIDIVVGILRVAWQTAKELTLAAWEAVRGYIAEKIEAARGVVVDKANALKQGAIDAWESLKTGTRDAFIAIGDFIWRPIEGAYGKVVEWIDKIIQLINRVLSTVGIDPIPLLGPQKASEAHAMRDGGTTEYMAQGGTKTRGGVGTSGRQDKHVVWNEQMGNEAWIAEKGPQSKQLANLDTAASWFDRKVVSKRDIERGHGKAPMRDGGTLGPVDFYAAHGAVAYEDLWTSRTASIARETESATSATPNTYTTHPDFDPRRAPYSIDWWSAGGGYQRGNPIGVELGDNVLDHIRGKYGAEMSYWIWNGADSYDGSIAAEEPHTDHVHATFMPGLDLGGGGGGTPGGGGGLSVLNPLLAVFNKGWDTLVQPVVDSFIDPLKNSDNVLMKAAGAMATKVPEGIKKWALANPKLKPTIGGGGGVSGDFTGDQAAVALEFAKNAVGRGIPGRLPVMTALQESSMQNLPGGDGTSAGYFQQTDNGAWGTYEDRTNPATALGMFLDQAGRFKGQYGNDPAGLGAWAQAVQASAYPDAYTKHWDAAGSLIGDSKFFADGGLATGPQRAIVGEGGRELILPLENRAVMQQARQTFGTFGIEARLTSLENALISRLDKGLDINDLGTPATNKILVSGEAGARRFTRTTEFGDRMKTAQDYRGIVTSMGGRT